MRSGLQKLSALVLHLIDVIQKLPNNNLSCNVKTNVAYPSSPTPIGRGGGGRGMVGSEDDERLILNLLDNDFSFQPNAFVKRNYHSLGGGSLEKLGGRGGTRNFFITITLVKVIL